MLLDIDTIDPKKLDEYVEKFYWFGFLCGDGHIDLRIKRKDIEFSLQEGDVEYVQAFADAVGYEGKIVLKKYYNKKYDKTYYKYVVEFGCELMVEDLKQLGWFGGKSEEKHLPPIVKELIKHAKQIAVREGVEWTDTNAGKVALIWFLGFYDAEGYLGKNDKNQFVISQTCISQGHENENGRHVGKELLEEIKSAYGINGEVRPKKKDGKITSRYELFFGKDDLEFFEKMLSVYEYGMKIFK